MSRTPVREVLIKLENDGLVQLIPRKGVRVSAISPSDMQEIYEILTLLEPEVAASLASSALSEKELKPLEQATEAMEEAIAARDLMKWAEADDQFHRHTLALHTNERLKNVVNGLLDQAHRARVFTLNLRDIPEQSTQEHRAIIKAIKGGDAEMARDVFRNHRLRAASELNAILEKFKLVRF